MGYLQKTWLVVGVLTALLTPSASTATASTATEQVENEKAPQGPLYYDVTDDPESLKLFALSTIQQAGKIARMDVIDVFRSPNHALKSTWKIDCSRGEMTVIHAASYDQGQATRELDVHTKTIKPAAEGIGGRMFLLACTGKGNLLKSRMHQGELSKILDQFWAGR